MWAARLLPASQQRRFAGAGGRDRPSQKQLSKRKADLVAEKFNSRQKEVTASREDYANGPVRLPKNDGFDPWSALAQRVCRLCSRKPVIGYCNRCSIELCGACITRMHTAPFKWICVECACGSDESEEQAKLVVSCQNEEVGKRSAVLAQPGMETENDLAGALAERILGDKGRHLEMAWWAEVKRKDWALHGERPVMPFAVMKAYAAAKPPGNEDEAEDEMGLPSAGSSDPHPHGEGSTVAEVVRSVVKAEPKEDEAALSDDEGKSAKRRRTLPGEGHRLEPVELRAPTTPAGTPAARTVGLVVAPPKTRARGSAAKALMVAASEDLMKQARINYGELVYAKSTAIAKESKARLVVQIAEARNLEPFPLTPAVIGEVAAVLRAADFASGATYLSEAKQVHLRKGYKWDSSLDLAMQDAERALTRALGPVVKAEEIPPKLWRVWQEAGRHGFTRSQMQPQAGPELWGMGSAFLLRETELAHLLMGSVALDLERREITLLLSMSKTDPGGKGARRTRSCVCSWPPEEEGEIDCPFHATVKVMAGRTKVLRGMGYEEEELKEFTVVGQVGCPTLMVSKEAMIAALRRDTEEACRSVDLAKHRLAAPNFERVTGHSLRRSGAKDAVKRHGLPLAMVQWLGRWGSGAVQGYVEDALEEMPENKVALTTWEGVARKTLEQTAKFEEIQRMIETVKAEVKTNDQNTRTMVQEIRDQARPKLVLNLSTLMVHATARSDSSEWVGNPLNWVTRCGGWRWAAAGRLAKPLSAREQVGEAVAICSKCRPDMIAEDLIDSSIPFSW